LIISKNACLGERMREKTFKARNFFDGGIFDSKIIQSLGGKGDTKIEI
jgi:hypothetical protein